MRSKWLNVRFIGLITVIVLIIVISTTFLSKNNNQNSPPKPTSKSVATQKKPQAPAIKISHLDVKQNSVVFSINSDQVTIQLCKPGIVRVDYLPGGKASPNTVVIGKTNWQPAGAHIENKAEMLVMTTDKMRVVFNKVTLSLSVYDAQDRLLMQQSNITDVTKDMIAFSHQANDNYYGIQGFDANADPSDGILRNSFAIATAGMQGYAGAPFVWSTSGYGLLVDSLVGRFSNDGKVMSFSARTKKDAQYYIFVGTPKEMFSSLGEVSGKPPMYPKWAMGFTNSEWGIDEKELKKIITTYRQKHIPIDNFTLDFDWKAWGEDNYGEFRWNEKKFPDGSTGQLKKWMDQRGVKLTGIMKPRIHVDTVQGKYATAHNFWFPNKKPFIDYFDHKKVDTLDFNKPEVRKWYFNDVLKHSFDTGIIGWWNDEADEGYGNTEFLNMEKALYDGQRAYTNQRVWSINRNFYLGSQRYAYGLWSGDIPTGFDSMAGQRARMLSAINVGEMKWGMDTGGFQGHPSNENYARWMEFSAFSPIFRVHGTLNEQRQPWVYGSIAEAAAKKAIQLRYTLIPYIYAYDRKANQTGIGIVTPLIFDYPHDAKVKNDVNAWMFGDYLLVSPVVEQGQTSKSIYLPAGKWTDYFTGKTYQGNQTIPYAVNAKTWDDIPLFIKQGAIIPTQPVMDYIGEKPVHTVQVDVFPDQKESSFAYYDDDGTTYGYEQGQYFLQTLSTKTNNQQDEFAISPVTGSYQPALAYYLLKFHGIHGKSVTAEQNTMSKAKDLASLKNGKEEGWAVGKDQYGAVTYVKVRAGQAKNIAVR